MKNFSWPIKKISKLFTQAEIYSTLKKGEKDF